MIVRLVSAALAAGFLAAVVATGLQLALTSPLILRAERYEMQASPARPPLSALIVPAHAHGDRGADHGEAEDWQPGAGLPRMVFTGLATLVGGIGYALLLGAVLLAIGREPTPESALAVGIGGFLAAALAPAIGLPPELPGMEAAPLALRQAWWAMTVLATGFGLYLVAVRRAPVAVLGGLILIVAPHLAGAPEVEEAVSRVPAADAARFAARALAVSFVFWATIGLAYGWAWGAFGRTRAPARA